jgi:hypothetical protein
MKRLAFAALASAALLAGCATPTPYQPLGAPTGVRGGDPGELFGHGGCIATIRARRPC